MSFEGLTDEGLKVPTGNEWLQLIRESINDRADEDLKFTENDLLGSITVEMAYRLGQLSEALKAIDDTRSVQTANGAYLEDLVGLLGIEKDPPRPSKIRHQQFSGDFQAIVEEGTRVRGGGPNGNLTWESNSGVELGTLLYVDRANYSSDQNADHTLEITIAGSTVSQTVSGLSTSDDFPGLQEILVGWESQFEQSSISELVEFERRDVNGDGYDDTMVIRSSKGFSMVTSITISAGSTIFKEKGAALVEMVAQENGPYTAATGVVAEIVDNVSGIDRSLNLTEPALGQFVESDKSLRESHGERLQRNSTASASAIRAKLDELDYVEAAVVPENKLDITQTVGGFVLAPSSVGVVVWPDVFTAEQEKEMASIVYSNVSHGIEIDTDQNNTSGDFTRTVETVGETTEDITIHYAETNTINVDITANIGPQFSENDIKKRIVSGVKDYIAQLSVADDVRRLEIYGIIDAVEPVETVTQLDLNSNPSDIAINATQIATVGTINVQF